MVDDVSTGLVTKTLSPSHPIPKWKTICRRIKRAADGDGKCPECEKPRVSYWCQQCESKRLRRKFNEWTSGNENIDKFLQSTQFNAPRHVKYMEFIPYSSFKNIKYLAKGGFGTIHSATWIQGPRWKEAPVWKRVAGHYYGRCGPTQVALKTLDHSAKMTSDFLQELLRHQEMLFPHWISKIIYCFGITQDPKTQNYVLVVDYASEGDLHSYLEKNSAKITWAQKLEILGEVASALVDIHRKDLVHGDLHTGNILVGMALSRASVSIGDLGSCRPVNASTNPEDIYGVLPYVAPEVLNGEKYTSASDVYSFGMILWEVSAGRKPFDDRPHDYNLALEICNGLRPEMIEGTPWRYAQLMRRCWDREPANRPSAAELASNLLGSKDASGFGNSPTDINDKKWREYLQRITESSKQQKFSVHPDAVYSSRLLDCPVRRKVKRLMTKSVGNES